MFIYACFVDFSSAFDSIWHKGLIYKLINLGIPHSIISVLKSMYSKLTSSVKSNGQLTKPFVCNIGTRQGCNLSPTLFNMYLNDLPHKFTKSNSSPIQLNGNLIGSLFYADDLVILSESVAGLQKSLNKLSKYCKTWKLNININKTKVMVFNSRKLNYDFFIDNYKLQVCDNINYLGLIYTPSGSFNSCFKYLSDKASRALFTIRSSMRELPGLPVRTYIKIFDTMVMPILLYGSEVWGPYLYKINKNTQIETLFNNFKTHVEKLHSKFCKQVLMLHKYSSNIGVRSELGRYPTVIYIIKNTANYYMNLLNRNKLMIIHDALQTQRVLSCISNNSCWYSTILNLNDQMNWYPTDAQTPDCKFKPTLNICKYLMNLYKQKFQHFILQDSKLKLFAKIKKNFGYERYLSTILNFKERQAITKLRISAHCLPVETGRYNRTNPQQRICPLCKNGIGDEEHYFTCCQNKEISSLIKSLKIKLTNINKTFLQFSAVNLFYYVLSMKDESILKTASFYINSLTTTFKHELEKLDKL